MLIYEVPGCTFTAERDPLDPSRWCLWQQLRAYGSKHWRGSLVGPDDATIPDLIRGRHCWPWLFSDDAIRDSMKILGLYSPRCDGLSVADLYRPSVDRAEGIMLDWCQSASANDEDMVRRGIYTARESRIVDDMIAFSTRWSRDMSHDPETALDLMLMVRAAPSPVLVSVLDTSF
jgi:hypothetical protein